MAKPKFDPNKPFSASDQAGKPPFDPNQSFEAIEENRLDISEEPSAIAKLGRGALDAAVKVGQFVDSYTGAPTRAAIGSIQDGGSPLSAFTKQFGEDPTKAPTGKEIALKAGVSDDPLAKFTGGDVARAAGAIPGPLGALVKMGTALLPNQALKAEFQPSAADVSGLGIDLAADPTNILPLSGAARGVLKAAPIAARGGSVLAKGAGQLAAQGIRKLPAGNSVVKGLQVAAEAPAAVKGALEHVFKPTQATDFPQLAAVAQKHGIDPSLIPESVEFGENSFISRASRGLREGPLGQPDLERFEEFRSAVQQATDSQLAKIGGGAPLSPVQAGATIRQGYDDAVERLFGDVDFTYNEVIRQAPGIRLTKDAAERLNSKLAGLEKWANGQLQRGITNTEKGQAQQVLNAVAAVRAGNGSLKQTYEAMSQIGRHAFKKGANALNDTPVDVKKFQDLYFTLRDEFINSTASQMGDDVANALIDSNQQITMFNANKKYVADLIGKDTLADERLFNSLIVNGDSKRIAALKEILSPEQLQQLKGAMLENLIKRDPDGAFNFATLHSAMRNKKNVLMALFSPEELVEFGELVKLGERAGPSVLSSSGTGASNQFRDLLKGVGDNTLTRSVVSGIKESARSRAARESAPRALSATKPSEYRVGISRPVRNNPEEAAKLLQMLGTIGTSKEKEEQTATQRRLEEIIKKRLAK